MLQEIKKLNEIYNFTDESAMNIAYDIAHKYSTCRLCGVGKGVGAIIIKNNKIISYGYNGVVDNIKPCTKETCLRISRNINHGIRRDECYGDCAEKRAFINAYINGIDVKDAKICVTKSPCISCCKMLINLGIKEVIYNEVYTNSEFSFEIMDKAGIKYRRIENFCREDHWISRLC